MEIMKIGLYTIFTILAFVEFSRACNGYKSRINSIVNCGNKNQVITIDTNSSITLTSDCKLVPTICISTTGFNTGNASLDVKRGAFKLFNGQMDMCKQLEVQAANSNPILDSMGLPDHCPIPEGKICSSSGMQIDVTKYRNHIAMIRGKLIVDTKIEHDTGSSCFQIEYEIYK